VWKDGWVGAFERVGSLAAVPEGEARGYDTAWGRAGVAHLPGGLVAFRDECPADGCLLSEGTLEDDDDAVVLVCPCDGSRFDLETGEPVRGGAVDAVPLLTARVEDGWIEVMGP
jgi:3-phenylpropionate/trans-cinnamate dioxygenase ferredoxin component